MIASSVHVLYNNFFFLTISTNKEKHQVITMRTKHTKE